MKKIISICVVAMLALPICAQDAWNTSTSTAVASDASNTQETTDAVVEPTTARNERLTQAGDFSIGLGLDPLTTFIGNAFNNSTYNSLDPLAGQAMYNNIASIMGSYMLTDHLGLHANIGFNIRCNNYNDYVLDDAVLFADPLSRSKVVDASRYSSSMGSFALGIEYHVGDKHAVQGVFGAGLVYGFEVNKEKYAYGNAITEANQVPTIHDVTLYETVSSSLPYARPLQSYTGSPEHFAGIYGTVGVEWFVAPKIALGLNVNLNIVYSFGTQTFTEYEGWNVTTSQYETYTDLVSPGNSSFEFSTANVGANIYAAFYF